MSHKLAGTNPPAPVAVLNFPFAAHPSSLLGFIRIISALSPDIKFTFFSISRINSSLFSGSNIKGLDNIKPYNVWDGLPEGYVRRAGPHLMEQVGLFLEKAPQSFERALKEVETETGHKFGCLISDGFLCFSGDIAEKMNIPWVAKWSAPRQLLVHLETDMIRERVGTSGLEDKTLDFLPGFSNEFRASDLDKEVIFENMGSPFSSVMDKLGQKITQATVVVLDCFETMDLKVIEELKKRLKKLLLVGPLHLARPVPSSVQSNDYKEEKDACLPWLDNHKPASVAYISFGSVLELPPMEVVALAEALEEGGFPFLWSFRGNLEDFPKGFIERTTTGKVVPWVNQLQILSHPSIGVFVTHGGWKSVMESVTYGVPMLGRPRFADQTLNIRSVEAVWKIGTKIEGGVFTKTRAIKALEQALSLEHGREMRHRVGVLKQLAHEAVGPNGSSARDLKALVEIIKS